MSDQFTALIGPLLAREGGYTNNPNDRGGETNWGVTEAVARANGYAGSMVSMTRDDATAIYRTAYWERPGFSMIADVAPAIAAELFDCGVNMGIGVGGVFLQRCLNVFNHNGRDYPDVSTDGQIGSRTLIALRAFITSRGTLGLGVLLKAMRCLRGARYISLAEARQQDEAFVYGWIDNRIAEGGHQ